MGGAPVTSALGSTAKPEIALAMLMAPFKSAWRVYPHLWHRKQMPFRFAFIPPSRSGLSRSLICNADESKEVYNHIHMEKMVTTISWEGVHCTTHTTH
ncbi:hypothetical protein GS458_0802 [Geobacillus stearothermophilus]|nr:hypothetical protein GS458_0802 [Geobacillus stearothermophilus]